MARPKHSGGAARPLTDTEVKRLLIITSNPQAMNHRRNTMLLKMMLTTAGRVGEVIGLSVADCYSGTDVLPSLVFRKTKTNATRRIPINRNLQAELKSYIEDSDLDFDGPLFPSSKGNRFLSAAAGSLLVKTLLINAGIPDASAHSTRKFALNSLLKLNVDLQTLKLISGHKNLSSLQHYLSSSSLEVEDAINLIRL
jgi:integrase/recombinase XerD